MPLPSRLALAVGLIVAAAVGVTSLSGSIAARRAITERMRSGAESVAEVVARSAALTAEIPGRLEAEVGEQMLTQARLLAHLVAVAEKAGLSAEEIDARLRQIAGPSGTEFLATDAEGTVVVTSDPRLGSFRFSSDPTVQPQTHAFHKLLGGDLPALVQDSRPGDDRDGLVKYAGVPGVDGPRIVRVGAEAGFLERADRVAGLRRLVADLVTGDVREIHVVDARVSPLVTRVVDAKGNSSDAIAALDQADAAIVRACITTGRATGRADGATYRAAAPVRRADGVAAGAALVVLGPGEGTRAFAWESLFPLLSALLVGLPAVLAAGWLGRAIGGPIALSTDGLDAVAAGDLSGTVPPGGDDETGRLLAATGRMTDTLREAMERIRHAIARLATEETGVSSTLVRQERAVHGFHGAATDVAGGIGQIAATAEHLLESATAVTATAHEAARVADEGRAGLDAMSESMRELDDAMSVFTRKLATIRQRAAGITSVVTTIAKVADQTNLLSVNATIEAEKAGEAGRGFRIVAQEIRRLADQTALATKDIERMVRDMQSAVSSGTMEMDRFRNEVSDRIRAVAEVGDRLTRIVEPVRGVTQSLEQLHDGMEGQAVSVRQVRDTMERLRGGAGQSAAATEAVTAAVDRFRMAIGDLNEEIARFRVEPAAAEVASERTAG